MMRNMTTFKQRLIIVGPPLLLLVIGAAVYIAVLKISQPQPQIIQAVPIDQASQSATPQSSAGAALTTVITEVNQVSPDQIKEWQAKVDQGQEKWRLDPLAVARQLGQEYGFGQADSFSLWQASSSAQPANATVEAKHQGKTYQILLVQPGVKGAKGIWVIDTISLMDL